MHNEWFNLFTWTAIIIYVAYSVNQKHGAIEKKIHVAHVFLAWLLLIMNAAGFKNLIWAVSNYSSISKYFYIPVGPLSSGFNLLTWIGSTFFSIAAMVLALILIQRNEAGLKWLIRLLPFIYFFSVTDALRVFYETEHSDIYPPLMHAITINGFIMALPYAGIYFFYTRESIKKQIFVRVKNNTEDQ